VDFYSGTDFLGSDTSSPYSVTWTNVPVGGYLLNARAIDNRAAVTVSANVSITVIVPPPGFADAFVARGQFTGFTNFLRGNSSTFTREPGEPRHEDRSGTRSGWVSWTAPASGICTLDTFNSGFDTVLSIYTGDLVSSLFKVAGNDDATPNTLQSRVTFSVTAGTRYEIAVDGYSAGLGGAIEFHLNLPNPFPIITSQPQSFLVDPGANVVFNVGAGGSGPFTYQWRFNGTNVAGATLPSLTRNNVQTADQGSYAVIVSNASGSVTSAPASLTLRLPPTIVSQPQNVTADPGGSATFSVGAAGLTPFAYQWSFNGSLIVGATNSSYTRSALQYADAGLFAVVVTNILGSAPSQAAELMIKPSIANQQFSNGVFQFTVRAMANRPHAVDVSTNLVNWIPMRTNTSATLDTIVNDPAAGSPWRFYRSRLVQ
jgi:Immunoglobulin domain